MILTKFYAYFGFYLFSPSRSAVQKMNIIAENTCDLMNWVNMTFAKKKRTKLKKKKTC